MTLLAVVGSLSLAACLAGQATAASTTRLAASAYSYDRIALTAQDVVTAVPPRSGPTGLRAEAGAAVGWSADSRFADLAAKAVGASEYPRFVSSGGEIIDTASPALRNQIDDVADSIVATGRPPTGVRQGGLPGRPGVYGNKGGQLPSRREGYYTESDVWAGTGPRGTERIVVGRRGEVWYSPDHYGTFRRIR